MSEYKSGWPEALAPEVRAAMQEAEQEAAQVKEEAKGLLPHIADPNELTREVVRLRRELQAANIEAALRQMRLQMLNFAIGITQGKEPATTMEVAERIRAFVEDGRVAQPRVQAVEKAEKLDPTLVVRPARWSFDDWPPRY